MRKKQSKKRLLLVALSLLLTVGLTLTGWAAEQRPIVSDEGVADAGRLCR